MNLSVADLLVTVVCMPDAILDAITELWYLGEAACMLIRYSQGERTTDRFFRESIRKN